LDNTVITADAAHTQHANGRWLRDRGAHFVTSLPPGAASGAQIAAWIRGHWKIKNQLHHVRDTTFAEDASRIRTCSLPRMMASLRNLAISVFRQDDHTTIAAACRYTAHDPQRPLTALGIT
jgi:predicted transposase YbfD/YdcC